MSTVGTLSLAHGYTGVPVWTLLDDADGLFALAGSDIVTTGPIDYETAARHTIRIGVSGILPPAPPRDFVIVVTDVLEDNPPPVITSPPTRPNVENTVLAHDLTASETVMWSIVGGADAGRFEIGSTLRWLSNGTKDFEAPNDADANNAYVVQVRATGTAGNQTNQTITVTVTDVVEGGGGGTAGEMFGFFFPLTKAT